MEKTRHYLLLREKLEATLQAGQDALYKSNDISDLTKSPVLSHNPASSPAPDSPNQRQRELAAKVTAGLRGLQNIYLNLTCSVHCTMMINTFFFSSFQCLRLLMHTFNREYSQVSSSASESKVSPSLGPLTRPFNPSQPLAFTFKYLSPTLRLLSAISFSHQSVIFSSFMSPPVCLTSLKTWVTYYSQPFFEA